MSAPVAFIAAPGVLTRLTRASDAVESATTDSLQKAECVVPNVRQDHVKKPVIPYLRKRAHSTARIAARSRMRETPVKVPYISKNKIDVCVCERSSLPDSDILEVIQADLPKTRRYKNQEFTAQESGQVVSI